MMQIVGWVSGNQPPKISTLYFKLPRGVLRMADITSNHTLVVEWERQEAIPAPGGWIITLHDVHYLLAQTAGGLTYDRTYWDEIESALPLTASYGTLSGDIPVKEYWMATMDAERAMLPNIQWEAE